jgi:hypothetical protein
MYALDQVHPGRAGSDFFWSVGAEAAHPSASSACRPVALQLRPRAQLAGVSSLTRLAGNSARPGKTLLRYWRIGIWYRRQVSTTDRMAATRGPARSLPTCSQFLRLWKAFHKKNYEQSGIRQSFVECGEKKFACLLCGGRVNAGEVLRASGSPARHGFVFISPQMGLPSNGG